MHGLICVLALAAETLPSPVVPPVNAPPPAVATVPVASPAANPVASPVASPGSPAGEKGASAPSVAVPITPAATVSPPPGSGGPATTGPAGAAATPAVPVGPARYSQEWLAAQLTALHTRYPRLTRLVELGRTHEGRPVLALAIARKLKRNDPRPAMLLNGAHHGVEVLSIDMVLDAIEVLLLRSTGKRERMPLRLPDPNVPQEKVPILRSDPELDRRVKRWLDELVIWCVPAVNPDGVWATLNGHPRSGRKNGRDTDSNGKIDSMDGVDLNRNYPFRWGFLGEVGSSSKPASFYYRGPEPGSEPETQAMMRLGESEHFAASISFHTGTVALLAPYTIDNVKDPMPNEAWQIGEHLVAGLGPHPQGKPFTLKRKLYSVDGTDQDWYRARFGTLAFLVEGARRDAKDEAERYAIVHTVRPSWIRLFERYLDGPTISGRVLDATGKPVIATVAIAEQPTYEGEVWETRCRDGRFDRFVPAPGRYTLRIGAEGAPSVEQVVEVGPGRTQIEIRLPAVPIRRACPAAP